MNFGDYLKEIRKEKGLSQRQLAELSGISNTEISRLESGNRVNPSPKTLKAIAPNLGVSYGDLLKKAGYIDETIDNDSFNLGDDRTLSLASKPLPNEFNNIKDVEFIKLMIKASNELPTEDIKVIKDLTNLLLGKNTKGFKNFISYVTVK